jgi:hypothetical protein
MNENTETEVPTLRDLDMNLAKVLAADPAMLGFTAEMLLNEVQKFRERLEREAIMLRLDRNTEPENP